MKKVLKQCKVCCRCEGSTYQLPNMPPLPKERVVEALPFEYTGLDPLFIKQYVIGADKPVYKKVWVCLFTCMVARVVHLELVEDMSADEFLLSWFVVVFHIKLFLIMRSNLRQLRKAILQVSDCVDDYLSTQGIHQKFIVELAPWMGGFYEHLVGLTKRALKSS